MGAQSGRDQTVRIGAAELFVTTWGTSPAEIVLLHDGLGSIAQFGSFPAALHEATGKSVMAYDRPGHGQSTPRPTGPWPTDWLSVEAARLNLVLDELASPQPTLIGHSDGGSIALLHAAAHPESINRIIAIASHSYVEEICFDKIAGMVSDSRVWIEALKPFHGDSSALFRAWSGVWTSTEFRSWDIRPLLRSVAAPSLIVQGSKDEYATSAMIAETVNAIGGNASAAVVDNGRHLLPQRNESEVVQLVASFLTKPTN